MNSCSSQPRAQVRCALRPENDNFGVFLRCALLIPGFLILPSLYAAGGPPPTTVQGHVSVEGVVEVLNDVLHQPFNQSRQISSTATSGSVSFDVPTGKRLIIETISVQAVVSAGLTMRVDGFATSQGDDVNIDIPLQAQGTFDTFGNQFSRAMQAVKIRVDGTASTGEILFAYTRIGVGISTMRVNIHGYLVDVTQ